MYDFYYLFLYQATVTPRYNAVVGRHLLGPPYKRGALWDPVDLFDIIIPRQSKGQAKLPRLEVELVYKHKSFISEHTVPMLAWLNIYIYTCLSKVQTKVCAGTQHHASKLVYMLLPKRVTQIYQNEAQA